MDDKTSVKAIISDAAAEDITRIEELAYELKISEVMTTQAHTISLDTKMADVLELMRTQKISGAPVMDHDKVVGIVSTENLIQCLVNKDLESEVNKYMSTNILFAKASDPVVEALKLFVNTKVGRLPVIEDNKLVGIITKGDITRGVLKALQRDYKTEELRRYRASHLFEDIESDRTSVILRYIIKPRDFVHGGTASSNIKKALQRLGGTPQITRKVSIAIYEAEMNLVIHTTNGGTIRVEIEPHIISIDAFDDGPGIEDVELALKPGWSTASDEIREMGFGAGMGLVNISRCVDSMKLESSPDIGTRLKMKINLDDGDKGTTTETSNQ
jgi:CBS domain-containing protein/anti-sigma regulatory factor (Ser/Thr protein kinase)